MCENFNVHVSISSLDSVCHSGEILRFARKPKLWYTINYKFELRNRATGLSESAVTLVVMTREIGETLYR